MHRYRPLWSENPDERVPVSCFDNPFRDALDVEQLAERDATTTWRTWPEVWHLDEEGRFRCGSKGSTGETVRTYAEEPGRLLECRLTWTGSRCPDHWVIIEPRHRHHADVYEVTEGDAQAFVLLRRQLARSQVNLLDVVVFHQEHRWWSLHELTSGTTAWSFAPVVRPLRRPARRGPRLR